MKASPGEVWLWQPKPWTHPLVVVLDLGGHANLHHQGGIFLTVFGQDEVTIFAREVLGGAHEEHLPTARGLALLLSHLGTTQGGSRNTQYTHRGLSRGRARISAGRSPEMSNSPGRSCRDGALTLAFFLMCFSNGCTAWGPGCDKVPKEYFFKGGRWNCRSFMGPMWVGKKGWRSSTAGIECCTRPERKARFQHVPKNIWAPVDHPQLREGSPLPTGGQNCSWARFGSRVSGART